MIYDELGHAGDCKRDRQRVQSRAIFAVISTTDRAFRDISRNYGWRRLIELAAGPACPSAATRRTLAEAVRK